MKLTLTFRPELENGNMNTIWIWLKRFLFLINIHDTLILASSVHLTTNKLSEFTIPSTDDTLWIGRVSLTNLGLELNVVHYLKHQYGTEIIIRLK